MDLLVLGWIARLLSGLLAASGLLFFNLLGPLKSFNATLLDHRLDLVGGHSVNLLMTDLSRDEAASLLMPADLK